MASSLVAVHTGGARPSRRKLVVEVSAYGRPSVTAQPQAGRVVAAAHPHVFGSLLRADVHDLGAARMKAAARGDGRRVGRLAGQDGVLAAGRGVGHRDH